MKLNAQTGNKTTRLLKILLNIQKREIMEIKSMKNIPFMEVRKIANKYMKVNIYATLARWASPGGINKET